MSDLDHLAGRFYNHAQLQVKQSKTQDHAVYKEVLMIELKTKGVRGESISVLITDDNREYYCDQFPGSWADYNGEVTGRSRSGTKLDVLELGVAADKEWNGLGIDSVEDLANITDGAAMKIRQGLNMKNAAMKYLDGQALAKSDVTTQQVQELIETSKQQAAEILELKKTQRKKPGPKPKVDDGHENAQAAM